MSTKDKHIPVNTPPHSSPTSTTRSTLPSENACLEYAEYSAAKMRVQIRCVDA